MSIQKEKKALLVPKARYNSDYSTGNLDFSNWASAEKNLNGIDFSKILKKHIGSLRSEDSSPTYRRPGQDNTVSKVAITEPNCVSKILQQNEK